MARSTRPRPPAKNAPLPKSGSGHISMWWVIAAAVLSVALVVGVVVAASLGQKQADEQAKSYVPAHLNAERNGIVVAGSGPVKVDVYLDFQCPGCALFEKLYGAKLVEMADAGQITYVQHTMSFMDQKLANTSSKRAAYAATCASDIDPALYGRYSMEVFKSQPEQEVRGKEAYSDELLLKTIPDRLLMSADQKEKLSRCTRAKSPAVFVESVNKAAYEAQVNQTPTLFVNGQRIPNEVFPPDADQFAQIVMSGSTQTSTPRR